MAAEVVGGSIVSGVASKVAESSFDHIKLEISYVFKYQRYLDDLKNRVQELEHRREMVEQPVQSARRQGDEIYKGVEDWLSRVNQFTQKVVQPIIEDENEAKKLCFKGMCPNFFRRYSLSKKAVKAAKDATDLLSKGNFSNVSYGSRPERIEFKNAVRDYQQFESRMKVFRDVMEALADSKVNMIGMHGMGGVGKTTLANLVAKKVMEDNLIFNEVVMVEVTHAPDEKIIQEKLASKLGLTFDQHDRADQLCRRLKQVKRVLVILDNIWGKLDLGAIGIPLGDDEKERKDEQSRCTVLLTSRDLSVLCKAMNCQKTFFIEVLNDEEAMSLFWNTVSDHSKQISDFQPLAVEIVGKCGGLPVAIKTIASALKNEGFPVWKDALTYLRNSNPREIPEMDDDVYSSIEWSYKFLKKEESKSLFLLCGLFYGGSQITISDLMRCGMGLGIFRRVNDLEEARNRVHGLIRTLKDSCLLLDGDTENDVKMHDVIHTVAISIAEKEHMFNIRNVDDSLKQLEDAMQEDTTVISLPYRDIRELPKWLKCPKLKLFFLSANYGNSLQFPNLFFEGMEELRVLHLTRIPFSSVPSSLGCLTNLQTLSLINCNDLKDVAILGDQLKKLDILSLHGSGIERLPVQIGQLTQIRLLDLGNCQRLVVIPPKVISNLSRLEELYLGNSFTQWENGEGGSNSSLAELNVLSKLTTLEIHIEDASVMLPNLFSVGLVRFKIFMGEWWSQWYDEDETSRTLKFEGLDKKIYLRNEIKMLLKKSEDLDLLKLNDFQNIVHELDEEGFPQLKHLSLQKGPEILYIVNSAGQVCCNVFPLLESLVLRNLINLEKICHGQLTNDQSFSKLKIVRVSKCDGLQHLFSFSMAKNLLQLQEIKVTDCKKLELIVGEEKENHNVHESESTNNFTQLHSLTLRSLPQLTAWGFNVEVSQATASSASKEIVMENDPKDLLTVLFSIKATFPTLKKLELSSLNIEQIWLAKMSTSSCPNLAKLEVKNCSRLKFLFSYSMVNSFIHLQELVIENCNSMECVIDATEFGDEERMIKAMDLPKLNNLELSDLPMLKRFISANSSGENNILYIDNRQPLFDEKVGFPNLERLRISGVSKLRKIWHHQLASGSFSKLKDLTITSCHELIDVFLFNIIVEGRFDRLVELSVGWCDSIEVIIEEEISSKCTVDEKFPLASTRLPVFPQLTSLNVWELPKLKSIYQGMRFLEWTALEDLEVDDCDKVEMLFGSSESLNWETKNQQPVFLIDHSKVGFPDLKILRISNMSKLTKIWSPQLASGSFSKLHRLEIKSCCELVNIFLSNMIVEGRFDRLEELSVYCCDSIEVIIEEETSSKCTVDEKFPLASARLPVFPQLTSLQVWELPKLKSIYQGTRILELKTLKYLKVDDCDKLETLFGSSQSLSGQTKNQQPVFLIDHSKVAFPNLKNLDIGGCDGLINLTTLSTVESIVKLARIEIRSCSMIEEIIQQIGEVKEESPVVFNQLVYLELNNLPRLQHFCVGNFTLEFPYLEKVVVSGCINMKIFSQGNLLTPNLQKVTNNFEEENEERWEGSLNSTIQKIFEEMTGFRGLETLMLSQAPCVKEMWHDQTLPVSFFGNLTTLIVDDCTLMSIAIPAALIRFLNNLDNLKVMNCDSVEEVFHLEELNADQHVRPLFPELTLLELINLPKLKRFCNFNGIMFGELYSLSIENCPNMEAFISNSTQVNITANMEPQAMTSEKNFMATDIQPFFDEKVSFLELEKLRLSKLPKLEQLVPSSFSFQHLWELEVSNCKRLKNLLTISTAKSLVNLKEMKITDCKIIEKVIELEIEEEVKEDPIIFKQLKYLELNCLPSLVSFCLGNYTLEFPLLEKIIVRECPKIKTFSQGDLITPKLQKLQVTELEALGRQS